MSDSWIIMVDLILFHSSGFITSSIITRSMSANIDKLCVGKEYMGNPLFENLFQLYIAFVTKIKNDMRNFLMNIADNISLRKRILIRSMVN